MDKDEERIRRAMAGDREAFTALVQSYWPVAERTARNILGDAQLAQDIAQEVFADIYVQRARYQPGFSFHAYVAAVAKHKSISLLRKRARPISLGVGAEAAPSTPEALFVQAMFRGALYAAVEELPELQRRILKAYALQDQSYRQIAAELGLTVGQVKIILHRIRKQLRRVRDDWES